MTNIVKKFLPVLFALVLVLSFSLATAMPATAQGNTWYVATTGSDTTGDGSQGNPWRTIQHAIGQAVASDTISVAAGTYTENVEVDRQLTLTGDLSQPSSVVVDAGGSGNAITLAVDGCVLQGFKAQNGEYGIYLDGSNSNTLTNNIATSNTRHGIYLDGSNNNTLTGNTVSGNSECGINLDGSNNNALTFNHITGNNIGIQIQPPVDASTISINFNNIYGNTNYGVDNTLGTPNTNAENNWWGANDGPSLSPGSGDKVSANVNYEPWIVLGVSANPTSIVADGSSTSTITSDMTINSNAEDTSGLGHIPDGTQIIFTTDKGSIGSLQATKETINGKTTAILTSSTVAGTATVTAKAPPHSVVAEDSTTIDFTTGPLHHFTFNTISSPQTTGITFSITITAKDQYENTVTSYTGTNTLSDTTNTISPNSTGSFTNGVWTGNVTITNVQTGVTIATTGANKSGTSNSFDVTAGSPDYIVISPATATIAAGASQTYTAEAFDQHDNSLGNVTNGTTFEIVAGAGGSWAANSYTSENTGTWTVTGTYSGKSDTATLTVTASPLDHIVISPATATIAAGASQTYTAEAFDQHDNSLGNVTNGTTFEIVAGAGGSWAANSYTSENTGTWTVTGTYSGKSDTATLTVIEGSLDHIVISPATATITAGDPQTYTAEAFDQHDNSLGNVTNGTTFEIVAGAGGSWAANSYTSENTGTWTVTGTYSGKSDTATLTVIEGSLPPTISIDSPQDGYLTTNSTATIEGTVAATPLLDEATLTVNGVSKTITVSDGVFSEQVSLVIGDNILTVSVSNVMGTDSDSITVTRGSTPVVDITSPLNGAIFQATPITVEGTVDAIPEVTEATLTLNGNASTITVTNGEFSETVDLAVGENTIVVSATNVAGASTSPFIAVTLNEEAPPTPPPPPSSTTNWWLIGGISGGITLIALVVFTMFLHR